MMTNSLEKKEKAGPMRAEAPNRWGFEVGLGLGRTELS